jgi:hypothetical protein
VRPRRRRYKDVVRGKRPLSINILDDDDGIASAAEDGFSDSDRRVI